MMKMAIQMLNEDRLINTGLLTVSLAIVISSLNPSVVGVQLLPLFICSVAIPPLAFNAFIIEYKKIFEIDADHRGYHLLASSGFSLTIFGLIVALFLKSGWAAGAFVLGAVLIFPSIRYLDRLVKLNKNTQQRKFSRRCNKCIPLRCSLTLRR